LLTRLWRQTDLTIRVGERYTRLEIISADQSKPAPEIRSGPLHSNAQAGSRTAEQGEGEVLG
jgi:hypothetical protein